MDIDIVIARYKEDINWTQNIKDKNIFIYNKFHNEKIHLPNVGREAHTYLYHIISNYYILNDITIFIQADPFHHCKDFFRIINNLNIDKDIQPLSKPTVEDELSKCRKDKAHPYGLFLAYFMKLLFDIDMDIKQTINVTYGAQFACTKNAILNRPIEFYKFLLNFVAYEECPIESYIFERLWLYIFNTDIPISNKYLLWMNDEYYR